MDKVVQENLDKLNCQEMQDLVMESVRNKHIEAFEVLTRYCKTLPVQVPAYFIDGNELLQIAWKNKCCFSISLVPVISMASGGPERALELLAAGVDPGDTPVGH